MVNTIGGIKHICDKGYLCTNTSCLHIGSHDVTESCIKQGCEAIGEEVACTILVNAISMSCIKANSCQNRHCSEINPHKHNIKCRSGWCPVVEENVKCITSRPELTVGRGVGKLNNKVVELKRKLDI